MSEPTVRWSYSFEANGVRTKSEWRGDSELAAIEAMRMCARLTGRATKFRLVKWTRKAKPKVVAKWTNDIRARCIFLSGNTTTWLREREDKLIRVTLEQLEL